jgi:hypothetical protein
LYRRLDPFLGLFADHFIGGTELEGGLLSNAIIVLRHLLEKIVGDAAFCQQWLPQFTQAHLDSIRGLFPALQIGLALARAQPEVCFVCFVLVRRDYSTLRTQHPLHSFVQRNRIKFLAFLFIYIFLNVLLLTDFGLTHTQKPEELEALVEDLVSRIASLDPRDVLFIPGGWRCLKTQSFIMHVVFCTGEDRLFAHMLGLVFIVALLVVCRPACVPRAFEASH